MKRIAIPISLAVVFVVWESCSRLAGSDLILPSPVNTLEMAIVFLSDAEFLLDFSTTLLRLFFALVINLLFAIPVATLSSASLFIERMVAVPVSFMRSLPILAIILVTLIWFKTESAILFVASLLIFPILYLGLFEGIRNVSGSYKEVTALYHIPVWRRLFRIYLPGVGIHLFTALTSAIGLGFKVMISAEIYCQPKFAVGTAFQRAWASLDTVSLFALSLIVVFTAGVMNFVLRILCGRFRHGL